MKKLLYLTIFLITPLILVSCDSDDDPITPAQPGNIFVSSIPSGAQIWVDGVNSTLVTPDTVKNLNPAVYEITLKLADYSDTTFSVSVSANQTSIVTNVQLLSIIDYFGPVRIYETIGTVGQPSGLDLSSGIAYGIAATNPDRDSVDIYYSSTGFLVQSADISPNMSRVTYFRVGNSTNLDDGVDSPVQDGSWGKSVSDTQTNYFFLYDNDQRYSKVKIQQGGGTPGNPSYVDVWWYYNRAAGNTRF